MPNDKCHNINIVWHGSSVTRSVSSMWNLDFLVHHISGEEEQKEHCRSNGNHLSVLDVVTIFLVVCFYIFFLLRLFLVVIKIISTCKTQQNKNLTLTTFHFNMVISYLKILIPCPPLWNVQWGAWNIKRF